ncbi:hypothetical protein KM043_001845 [Ampulex compressa]|nr:hypothetical protein KM043_001845 [Ampulex compressa]
MARCDQREEEDLPPQREIGQSAGATRFASTDESNRPVLPCDFFERFGIWVERFAATPTQPLLLQGRFLVRHRGRPLRHQIKRSATSSIGIFHALTTNRGDSKGWAAGLSVSRNPSGQSFEESAVCQVNCGASERKEPNVRATRRTLQGHKNRCSGRKEDSAQTP